MREFKRLFNNVKEERIDPQTILMLKIDPLSVPLDRLMAQFKWAVNNRVKDDDFLLIRKSLVARSTEKTVSDLEVNNL